MVLQSSGGSEKRLECGSKHSQGAWIRFKKLAECVFLPTEILKKTKKMNSASNLKLRRNTVCDTCATYFDKKLSVLLSTQR